MAINLKAKQQLQYVGKEAGGGGDEVLNPFHQHNADTPGRVPTQKKEGASLRHALFSMDIKYIIDFILLPQNLHLEHCRRACRFEHLLERLRSCRDLLEHHFVHTFLHLRLGKQCSTRS